MGQKQPLFTPDMKCYSDSFLSDFLRSIKENQRQDFLDQWNADRCKRERIYISYDSTNENCQAGDIDIVEFGAAKVISATWTAVGFPLSLW